MASSRVLKALASLDLRYDASAVDSRFIEDKDRRLATFLDSLWGDQIHEPAYLNNVGFHSSFPNGIRTERNPTRIREAQPKYIPIDGSSNNASILEVPNSCSLADYVTARQMIDHIDAAVDLASQNDVYVSLGFHIDTAATWINRVATAIEYAKNIYGDKVAFVTVKDVADRF